MAESEVDETEGEGEAKKSSKKILIIVVAFVLLVAAGAGYFFISGDTDSPEEGEETELVEEEASEEVPEALYYNIEKPFIVNFPKSSGASLIQVSVSILANGEETVAALKKHQPMIRNNLLMIISGKGAKNLATREGKEALRSDMLKEIGSIMQQMTGENKVNNIFFTSFVMQ